MKVERTLLFSLGLALNELCCTEAMNTVFTVHNNLNLFSAKQSSATKCYHKRRTLSRNNKISVWNKELFWNFDEKFQNLLSDSKELSMRGMMLLHSDCRYEGVVLLAEGKQSQPNSSNSLPKQLIHWLLLLYPASWIKAIIIDDVVTWAGLPIVPGQTPCLISKPWGWNGSMNESESTDTV